MREVAAIGVGMTKWGELWKKSLRDIYVETALLALEDAGVDKVDSMYVGSMTPGLFVGQEHIAAMLADYLGQAPVPSARVETACASGALAMKLGFMEVAAGMSDVALRVYDIKGRPVRTLVEGQQTQGSKSVTWDGRNDDGMRVPPGVYFYRLTARGSSQTRKMVLIE